MYKVARSYLHNDADAADAISETVLLLYYGEGFTVQEIARAMELKEETVKTRLKRAKARFKLAYEAE